MTDEPIPPSSPARSGRSIVTVSSPITPIPIVHGVVTFVIGSDGLQFEFHKKKSKYVENTDIAAYLDVVFGAHSAIDVQKLPIPNPLDLSVWTECFIVLELDRRLNWRFQSGDAGLTMKGSTSAGTYLNLIHVVQESDGSLTSYPTKLPDGLDCSLLYLWASQPPPPLKPGDTPDAYNLYVDFDQIDDKHFPIIVDPDIKNTGPPSFP